MAGASFAAAQATSTTATSTKAMSQLIFPIPELGNCDSRASCKSYCDDPAHSSACISYAESHGLMSKEDSQKARQFIKLKGPGGCTGPECKTYCADPAHQDECLAFAKTNHLLAPQEQKLLDVLATTGGPGGCTTKDACALYCAAPAHRGECNQFAIDNGMQPRLIKPDMGSSTRPDMGPPAQLRGRIEQLLASSTGPGGCTSVDSCKQYCSDATHGTECSAWAVQNGLTQGGGKQGSSTRQNMTGPGGCTTKESCMAYCQANPDACKTQGNMPVQNARPFMTSSTTKPNIESMTPQQIQEKCAQYGGTWNGTYCLPPIRQGTQNPQTLQLMQQKCAQYGGIWNGTTCQKSATTTQLPMARFVASVFAIFGLH